MPYPGSKKAKEASIPTATPRPPAEESSAEHFSADPKPASDAPPSEEQVTQAEHLFDAEQPFVATEPVHDTSAEAYEEEEIYTDGREDDNGDAVAGEISFPAPAPDEGQDVVEQESTGNGENDSDNGIGNIEDAQIKEADPLDDRTGDSTHASQYVSGELPLALASELKSSSGAADSKAMDNDKLQAERVRLKEVVHKFVARALAGSPCTLLAESGRTAVKYCIDSSLETFSLVSATDMSQTLIACRIANIEDVYSIADDGTAPFPAAVLTVLQQDELSSLLMIVFRGPQSRLYRFCMLEESEKTCTSFLEALSCLHMYAQPQAGKLRKQVAEEHSKLYCQDGEEIDLDRIANGAAEAALAQQASVGFFLKCAGVRGGRGPWGAIKCKAMKLSRPVPITPLSAKQVPGYLGSYGYAASTATAWRITPAVSGLGSRPRLDIGVTQHIEVAGHTWYMMECVMNLEGPLLHPRLEWQVPRRLAHLRQDLHDPVKALLGKTYNKHFSGSRFARAGGVPGTTATLRKWCSTLATLLRSGAAVPSLVALVLRFLEAPSPELPSDAIQYSQPVNPGGD